MSISSAAHAIPFSKLGSLQYRRHDDLYQVFLHPAAYAAQHRIFGVVALTSVLFWAIATLKIAPSKPRHPWRRGSCYLLQGHLVSECLESLDCATSYRVMIQLVEVVRPQVLVCRAFLEHVVDDHEYRMSNCYRCSVASATSCNAMVLG